MTFDLEAIPPGDRYRILASLITPRPIAWVTTQDREGKINAAPFSFFNVFGSTHHLLRLLQETKTERLQKTPLGTFVKPENLSFIWLTNRLAK